MTMPTDDLAGPRPRTEEGMRAFVVTPFARMARTHAASTMGDAMVAASLAGSLFFSMPQGEARGPVLNYLVITMLPFAVISPLIGPLIDRMQGGHRLMVIGTAAGRAALCWFMISQIGGDSPVFFLLALLILVGQKSYQVARSALVPAVVRSDAELVEANSKLSLISAISGFVGVLPAAALMQLFGPEWSIGLAMATYAACAVLGTRIPPARVAAEAPDEVERHELRGATIIMAGSAMATIRICVGFLLMLVAFDFQGGGRATWEFGLVAGVSVVSQPLGAVVAPRLRKLTSEENLLTGVLSLLVIGAFLSLLMGDVIGAMVVGSTVGFAAGGGKLAFDSILQRDAPDVNRGRAFARFETRFQVAWVLGALVPVAISMSAGMGFAVIFVLAVVALTSYLVARLAYSHRVGTRQTAASAAAVGIEKRFSEVSGEVRGRISSAPRAAYARFRTGRAVEDEYDDDEYDEYDEYDDEYEYDDGGYEGDEYEGDDGGEGAPVAEAVTELEQTTVVDDGPDLDDDQDQWPEPAWADRPTQVHSGWDPPDDAEFPWEAPPEPATRPGAFLDDVDPSVANPYPWSPDED